MSRLIDLDAAIEVQMYDEEHETWSLKKMTVEDYLSYASEMPPIIEEPREACKWDFIGDNMYQCKCCGNVYTIKQFENLKSRISDPDLPAFCPACGSDKRPK